jgi:hypothetical protein
VGKNSNKNIQKNTVAIDGSPKRLLVIDTTGCNTQK